MWHNTATAMRLALVLVAYFASASTSNAQTSQVIYTSFDPLVIRFDYAQPILFEAKISGSPSKVLFEYSLSNPQNPTEMVMRDDGTGGDRQSADGVYTVTFSASQIVGNLRPDEMFIRFIGFLDVFNGETRTLRGNIFANIYNNNIPPVPVTVLAPDVQRTGHIVNVVDPSFFGGTTFDNTRITRKFYQFLPDDFDFLNIVYAPTHFMNRSHFATRNEVQGIGLSLFNNSPSFGSAGKLRGITVFPNLSLFDGAEAGYQHELGHQWINFLNIAPFQSGIPHWPLSSLASGIMGWSDPITRQGFDFPCTLVPESGGVRLVPRTGAAVFTDFDLYLMGLLPPEQVADQLVFADQVQARNLTCNNQLFTGSTIQVKVSDIINALGPRIPDSAQSPKRFKVATVVVSKDGLLSDEAMAQLSLLARRAEETREVPYHLGFATGIAKPFAISTRGLATIDTCLVGKCSLTPVVSAISPNSGPSEGGTGITITGTGFVSGAKVMIGETTATNIVVASDTTINATTVANAPGSYDVVVINPDGQKSVLANGYTYVTGPVITAASVSGKKLIITGERFDTGAAILLNGDKQKTSNDEVDPTRTLIAKKAGKKIAHGDTVSLQVRNSDGRVSLAFSYTRP